MHSKRSPDAQTQPGAGDGESLAPVIRLRPVRTLVLSPDLAYRERALTVLSDLGPVSFAAASIAAPGDVAALLDEEPADVVLLDATGGETAAREVIETLARTAPRTGIVVACEHCTGAARDLRALPKWDLLSLPWVVSPSRKWRAESAEREHGEGDDGFL